MLIVIRDSQNYYSVSVTIDCVGVYTLSLNRFKLIYTLDIGNTESFYPI